METTLGVDVLGSSSPERRAGGGGDAQRAGRPARHAGDRRERRVRPRDRASRPVRRTLTSVACPDLAAIIQAGFPFDQHVVDTVRGYCEPLREAEVDTVVLGCTHYPLVRPMLQRMLGRGVNIIVSGDPLAHQVEHVLGARGLANPRGDEPAGSSRAATRSCARATSRPSARSARASSSCR